MYPRSHPGRPFTLVGGEVFCNYTINQSYKAGGPFLPLVEPEAAYLPLVGLSISQPPPYTVEDDPVMSSSSIVTYTSVYTDSELRESLLGAYEDLFMEVSPLVTIQYDRPPLCITPVAPPSPNMCQDLSTHRLPITCPTPIRRRTPRMIMLIIPLTEGMMMMNGDDEPSDDDDDDDTDDEDEDEEPFEDEDDDEEDEHLAPADSSAIPVVDPVPSAGDTEAFETGEASPTPAEVERLLALPIPPPSPLSPWSSPLPQIPSPPLPPPPSSIHLPPPVLTSLPLPSSSLPPLPASLSMPPSVDRMEDTFEVELPPRKRLCLTTPTLRLEVIEQTMEAVEEVAPTTLEGVNARVTELAAVQEQDTQDIYIFYHKTARLLDQEALFSREAWAHSVGLSLAVHYELQAYRTHTQMQDYRIASHESLTATLIAQARDQAHVDDPEGAGSSAQNNMLPRRSFVTARFAIAAATPMTAAAVEQLIEARVSAVLANHETL
ncbi:hypothetical protein Tco_1149102 [Tanacetum coccineum]